MKRRTRGKGRKREKRKRGRWRKIGEASKYDADGIQGHGMSLETHRVELEDGKRRKRERGKRRKGEGVGRWGEASGYNADGIHGHKLGLGTHRVELDVYKCSDVSSKRIRHSYSSCEMFRTATFNSECVENFFLGEGDFGQETSPLSRSRGRL